jgi:hypothetical protein
LKLREHLGLLDSMYGTAEATSADSFAPYPSYYSSHYAQAYAFASTSASDNHTLAGGNHQPSPLAIPPLHPDPERPKPFHQRNSTWFQPGHHRCTYRDCSFLGSFKSLEIHRMDRHLIFPSDWGERKQEVTWDADPSLKGCESIFCMSYGLF